MVRINKEICKKFLCASLRLCAFALNFFIQTESLLVTILLCLNKKFNTKAQRKLFIFTIPALFNKGY